MKMSLVIIPSFISDQLKAAQAPLRALTDVKSLLSILSKQDVAFYYYCQLLAREGVEENGREQCVLHPAVAKTFFSGGYETPAFAKSDNGLSEADKDFIWAETGKLRLQNQAYSIRPLYDGLMDTASGGNHHSDYAFDIIDVSEDTLGLVLVPMNDDESRHMQELSSYDKLLRTLNVYERFEAVATTPAFGRFVELNQTSY